MIIPAFNAGAFVTRALDSVKAQEHANWEVVIVEDGSHDQTERLVKEFRADVAQDVLYVNNDSNCGVSESRNRAMKLASGDVFAFLDADDWWRPSHLSDGLKALAKQGGMSYSSFQTFFDLDRHFGEVIEPNERQRGDSLASLYQCNFIQTASAVMLSRAAASETGTFDSLLRVGEDLDYWIRVIGCGHSFQWTGSNTCIYSKSGSSAMSKTLSVAEELIKFHRKHLHSTFLPTSLRRRKLADSLFQYGRLIRRTERTTALHSFMEAASLVPLTLKYILYAAATAAPLARERCSSQPGAGTR